MNLEFTLDKVFSTCSMKDNRFTTFIFKHLTEHNVQYNTDTLLSIYKIKLIHLIIDYKKLNTELF